MLSMNITGTHIRREAYHNVEQVKKLLISHSRLLCSYKKKRMKNLGSEVPLYFYIKIFKLPKKKTKKDEKLPMY